MPRTNGNESNFAEIVFCWKNKTYERKKERNACRLMYFKLILVFNSSLRGIYVINNSFMVNLKVDVSAKRIYVEAYYFGLSVSIPFDEYFVHLMY